MRHAPLLILMVTACNQDSGVKIYDSEPSVSITQPIDGMVVDENTLVEFEARVGDEDREELACTWISDIDDVLQADSPVDIDGLVSFATANLSPGNHTITLNCTDVVGQSAAAQIGISVVDLPDAPEIEIVHPATNEPAYEGTPFEFQAVVSDAQDIPEDIVVEIESDLDYLLCTTRGDVTGSAECSVELSGGTHFLTFTATDTDGYASQATAYLAVTSADDIDGDGDGWTDAQGDCDDTDPSVHPGADEFYNGVDDDCDSIIDEGTEGYDDDEDGYREADGDCDDTDAQTYPYANELEDSLDNDCDTKVDEGTDAYDDDGDGYTENDGDCDDDEPDVAPFADEWCDSVDNDCDGSTDEKNALDCDDWYADDDGDGYGDSSDSECLCAATSAYPESDSTDCYDKNGSVNPGQTSYFSVQRGDTSYDYDCDGSETKQSTGKHDCGSWPGCSATAGWESSTPSCGGSGTWVTACDIDWFSCSVSASSTKTQACK